jgi:hypothetical protein
LSDGTKLPRPIRHPNVCNAEPAPSFRLLELQGTVIHRVVTSEGASLTRSLSLERKWVVDAPTEPQLARLLPSSDRDERAVRRPCLSYRPGCLDPHGVWSTLLMW